MFHQPLIVLVLVVVLVLEKLLRPTGLKIQKVNFAEPSPPNNAKTFEDENDDEYDMWCF